MSGVRAFPVAVWLLGRFPWLGRNVAVLWARPGNDSRVWVADRSLERLALERLPAVGTPAPPPEIEAILFIGGVLYPGAKAWANDEQRCVDVVSGPGVEVGIVLRAEGRISLVVPGRSKPSFVEGLVDGLSSEQHLVQINLLLGADQIAQDTWQPLGKRVLAKGWDLVVWEITKGELDAVRVAADWTFTPVADRLAWREDRVLAQSATLHGAWAALRSRRPQMGRLEAALKHRAGDEELVPKKSQHRNSGTKSVQNNLGPIPVPPVRNSREITAEQHQNGATAMGTPQRWHSPPAGSALRRASRQLGDLNLDDPGTWPTTPEFRVRMEKVQNALIASGDVISAAEAGVWLEELQRTIGEKPSQVSLPAKSPPHPPVGGLFSKPSPAPGPSPERRNPTPFLPMEAP